MKSKIALIALLCLLAPQVCKADLLVNGYNGDLHDRFNNSSMFAGNPYNWSGVGQRVAGGGGFWATMVSDSFALSVSHSYPAVGSTVRYYHSNDPTGAFEDKEVAQTFSFGSADLRLIRFTSAVSSDVEKYSVLNTSVSYAAGLNLHVFGLASPADFALGTRVRYGTNTVDQVYTAGQIDGINYDAMLWDYDVSEGVGEAKVNGGDSGAPSFVIHDGAPVLIGLHNFLYSDGPEIGSGDIFLTTYLDSVDTIMSGFGESLNIISVPEPGSGLLVVMMFGLFCRRTRQSRQCLTD